MVYKQRKSSPAYAKLLSDIQAGSNEVFWKINSENKNKEETKQMILAFYRRHIEKNEISIDEYEDEELCEKLYNDTHGFSVLSAPLKDDNVEGIHISGWNNVIIDFKNGKSQHIDSFESQQHAIDILRRMLQEKGQVLDEAMPIAETSIGSDIRITTAKSPIVDEDIGVGCYIRKLSKQVFTIDRYIDNGFADKGELDLLKTFMRRGVSILIVGKVNTGKTTFLSYLLSTLPHRMKIVTIENAAREMDLVEKDKDGCVLNNVIHMLTRESKNADQDIKQEDLVVISLRLNPDYISIAEMRDKEASAAVEASRSGHPIISTTHAGSPKEAHDRIADLSRKAYSTDFETAFKQAQSAFPVVVFLHTLEDEKRRIMGITECFIDNENKAHYNPLWKYEIEENKIDEDGVPVIIGEHKQVGICSEFLIEKMKMYGISKKEIDAIQRGV